MRFTIALLSTAMLACSTVAHSETAAVALDAAADAAEDRPIIVEGERGHYGAARTSTGTRTDTPVRDVPQAMTIITERQIEDQALRSVADLLNFVPGATPGTGEGNRDQITLRGNNTTADFFIDGIRDDVQYFRDFYNLSRIEVLKGPNAMIFGRGGGGGVVNRVTKRSTLQTLRQFELSGDSEGGIRATGDINQPLSATVGLRVNGLYEDGNSFRRNVDLTRYGINPTLGIDAGQATRIDLSYEFFHDRRTTDRGVPSVVDPTGIDEPLRGSDRTFFGDPDLSYSKANIHLASAGIEHQLAEGLTLRNRTLFGDYDKLYQNVFPNGAVGVPGTVQLLAYYDTTRRQNLFNQTDLIWKVAAGRIDHTFLLGVELGRQTSRQRRVNGFFQPTDSPTLLVPVGTPTVDADIIFRPINTNALRTPANHVRGKATIAAFYFQDQIRLADWIELIAGLRFDRFDLDITNRNNGAGFGRVDNLWSPRLGLVVKPISSLSLYGSYSVSYLPQSGDQFSGLDLNSEALKPERFENFELGAKWEPIDGLLATAAIYQLDRTNSRATDPLDTTRIVLSGAQRSRGIELGLERSINHRWQISAGYALQSAEITETTTAAPKGRKVPLVPRHSFSLWSRYDVTAKLGLGVGVIARSRSYASLSNAVKLPGYTRLDAAAFYKIAPRVEAQVNIENLLGTDYFPSAHNDNNIAPGAPTTAKLGLRFRI